MDKYRSQSCRDMQLENYNYGDKDSAVPSGMNDLRSYSINYYSSSSSVHHPPPKPAGYKEIQIKKVKNSTSQGGGGGGSISCKSWSFNDPELKRKKRVVGYKVYAVEGKMKGSFKKSFKWIKDIVNNWR